MPEVRLVRRVQTSRDRSARYYVLVPISKLERENTEGNESQSKDWNQRNVVRVSNIIWQKLDDAFWHFIMLSSSSRVNSSSFGTDGRHQDPKPTLQDDHGKDRAYLSTCGGVVEHWRGAGHRCQSANLNSGGLTAAKRDRKTGFS